MVMTTINKIMNMFDAPGARVRRGGPVQRPRTSNKSKKLRQVKTSHRKAAKVPFKMFKRKIKFPSNGAKLDRFLHTRYSDHVQSGLFQYNFYTMLRPMAKFHSLRRAIRFHYTFLFIVLASVIALLVYNYYNTGNMLFIQPDTVMVFVVWALIAAYFTRRRVKDEVAYYNMRAVEDKHNLNRAALNLYHTVPNTMHHQELQVIELFRKQYNKYILFPTDVERNVHPQLGERLYRDYYKPVHVDAVENYKRQFTVKNLKAEHNAARQIAEIKVEMFGGKNEYDEMVKHHVGRMDPILRIELGLEDK